MKRLLILLAACLTACAGQNDGLLLQSLNFPEQTDNSFVTIEPKQPMALKAFTLCMKILSEARDTVSVFSYATSTHHNQLLLGLGSDNLRLHLAEEQVEFRIRRPLVGWMPICVTWDSQTGNTRVWVNGSRTVTKICSKGKDVVAGGVVILGQDQDQVGGGFSKKQSFMGEVTDLNLWNLVRRDTEMPTCSRLERGNVIDWTNVKYQITGRVLVQGPDE
ncbi:pentraxin fusion protein-like [Heterodontus francisci]|uniref:pentraxin fusion protein-like n=1 Tax=Heterodontus francisci TaxID=7792 RepID=UPI00355B58BB